MNARFEAMRSVLVRTNSNPDMVRLVHEFSEQMSIPIIETIDRDALKSYDSFLIPCPSMQNIWLLLKCKMFRKTVTIGLHDIVGHDRRDVIKVFLYNSFVALMASKIIVFSNYSHRQLKHYFLRNSDVFYFGKNYRPLPNRQKCLDILMFGRFRHYTGHDQFLRLVKANPKLLFCAAGKDVPTYWEELPNLRIIRRFLSDEELFDLIHSTRFICLPYRSATQSGAVPLAMAAGAGVLYNDVGGIKEQSFGFNSFDLCKISDEVGILPADLPTIDNCYRNWRHAAYKSETFGK